MINTLLSQTSNSGTGLLVIGSGKNPADYVTQFWNAVAAVAPALPITHVNNAGIAGATFENFKLVCIASDYQNVGNGLSAAEWNALMLRKPALRKFVNCGGGVFAMCAPEPQVNPNWRDSGTRFGSG